MFAGIEIVETAQTALVIDDVHAYPVMEGWMIIIRMMFHRADFVSKIIDHIRKIIIGIVKMKGFIVDMIKEIRRHIMLLVLGSEGRGLRTLVAKACTGFVRIPGSSDVGGGLDEEEEEGDGSPVGVDSLNVSVTGGIMLWHLMRGGVGGSR